MRKEFYFLSFASDFVLNCFGNYQVVALRRNEIIVYNNYKLDTDNLHK